MTIDLILPGNWKIQFINRENGDEDKQEPFKWLHHQVNKTFLLHIFPDVMRQAEEDGSNIAGK
mgnify:CR=1 FL=1